jgi:hypothetical protein
MSIITLRTHNDFDGLVPGFSSIYYFAKGEYMRHKFPPERSQRLEYRVSTEFRRHGIPRNFLTSEVISAQFRRNSAKFRGIPRNSAGIESEITSVFRGIPKCHFRGHPTRVPAVIPRLPRKAGGERCNRDAVTARF